MLVMPFGCTAISTLLTNWSMKQRLTAMPGSCTSAVNQSMVWPVSGVKLRLPGAVTVTGSPAALTVIEEPSMKRPVSTRAVTDVTKKFFALLAAPVVAKPPMRTTVPARWPSASQEPALRVRPVAPDATVVCAVVRPPAVKSRRSSAASSTA